MTRTLEVGDHAVVRPKTDADRRTIDWIGRHVTVVALHRTRATVRFGEQTARIRLTDLRWSAPLSEGGWRP